jgi:hypothetical protein
MPLTAAQIVQARILERTGDFDPTSGDALPVGAGGGFLEQQIAGVWAQYADKAYVAPRLQELYVTRALLLRGQTARRQVYDFSDSDAKFTPSQVYDHFAAELATVEQEITETLAMAAANRAPAVGPILTQAPIGPPVPGGVDANDRRYGGDPYRRRFRYP